jgi:hypothetical protein
MASQTVKLSRVLSVSFSSEVLTQYSYLPKDSSCKSCNGACGDGNVALEGCSAAVAAPKGPLHALTVHQVTDGILRCESPGDSRVLQARYVVTDDDGQAEYLALRAFKDDGELLGWIETIGEDFVEVKANLESHLTPLLHN